MRIHMSISEHAGQLNVLISPNDIIFNSMACLVRELQTFCVLSNQNKAHAHARADEQKLIHRSLEHLNIYVRHEFQFIRTSY